MPQIDSSHSSSLRPLLWGSVRREGEARGRERESRAERRDPSGPEDSALMR